MIPSLHEPQFYDGVDADSLYAAFDRPAWHANAACLTIDPDLFFPERGDASSDDSSCEQAKAVCANCPVKDDCLAYAIAKPEVFGVWGGLSAKQRRPLRQQWVRANPKPETVPRETQPPRIPQASRPHGTYQKYRSGCRCQPCRDAKNADTLRYKRRLAS